MKRFLALIDVGDNVTEHTIITPGEIANVQIVPTINPVFYENLALFLAHWNAGVEARQKWDVFSDNFFKLFTESGVIDENGLHLDDYDLGSICRFIIKNKDDMLPKSFKESMFAGMLVGALKMGASTMKKGKDIEVDWNQMAVYGKPMAAVVLSQLAQQEDRRIILMPIIRAIFEDDLREADESTTDN